MASTERHQTLIIRDRRWQILLRISHKRKAAMTIFSLLPLLAFAVSAHLAFTPTQPPALERERVEQNGTEKVFRYVARLAPFCLKVSTGCA